MKTQFLIAAPTSGSGKTTIARGLMALYSSRGLKVQPFKCGPDYIDTKFHEAVCHRPSVNLDTFMNTPDRVRQLFARYAEGADVCIVEGMMGLFDGYDHDRGSSAEIARTLGLPVVLVVNARSSAYSMAALLKGYTEFRPDVRLAGVIFNQVGSPRHRAMLQEVCQDLGLRCFGYVARSAELEQSSRYLGLDFSSLSADAPQWTTLFPFADQLLELRAPAPGASTPPAGPTTAAGDTVLVARNAESFSFVYRETLDALGPTVRFFDPETDVPRLDDVSLLYLPGGYPEKHLDALVANEAARRAIRDYAERGGRIVAECGGMMYLCREILTDDGAYPMCGVLPHAITARTADRRLSLGYRRFMLDGREYRGHEFHYTQFADAAPTSVCQVYNAKGEPVASPVIIYKNVRASYIHCTLTGTPPTQKETPSLRGEQDETPSLMLAGTGSDVGKSVLATALCRIFKQDGYHPAPFKAQNMALNSYATPDGLEIGRAQAVQAEAAGIPCHTDMNPLLLKPQSDHTSQVVLGGRPIGNRDAYDYFRREGRDELRRAVCDAYDRLARRYSPIVMEGAGSISEINLRDTDLVNLPMARHAGASVILVADIDRGGVFASVYGSIALQTPEDRRLIKGIIINKFRGDLRLFDEGRRMIEQICHVPVLGVVPYMSDIHIEEEDSVALAGKQMQAQQGGRVNIAVVMLRHLSNYTDFDALEHDARIHLYYTNNPTELRKADIIVVPGSKSTLSDLYELRRNGCAEAIVQAHRAGTTVVGICGGYQMMGVEVLDPDHVEGDIARLPGLGLLPTTTTMSGRKVTRQVGFRQASLYEGRGYEIHMGETRPFGDAPARPFALLDDGQADGYVADERCMGTYIHGVLDNPSVVDWLLRPYADRLSEAARPFDYAAFKEEQYDKLAAHVRKYVDIDRLYDILNIEH